MEVATVARGKSDCIDWFSGGSTGTEGNDW